MCCISNKVVAANQPKHEERAILMALANSKEKEKGINSARCLSTMIEAGNQGRCRKKKTEVV